MSRKEMTREQVLDLLEAAPKRIAELTEGLTPEQLRTRPAPDEWSAVEVLAHLRSCVDVRGGAIERILAEDSPTIRAMDPRTLTPQTDYPDLPFQVSFEAFATQRASLVRALKALPPEGWERSATVVGAGKPLTRTAHFFAQWLVVHERPHIKQIAKIAAALRPG